MSGALRSRLRIITFCRKEVPCWETRKRLHTIAVKGIAAARKFYQDVLGLRAVETQEAGVLSLKSGNSTVLVYESR